MSDISGGSLSFKSEMNNEQLNSAIEETIRRVQGLSDATIKSGKLIDASFDGTAESVRAAIGQIGDACEAHEQTLSALEAKYDELGKKSGDAFMQGRSKEVAKIKELQQTIQGEIAVRKSVLGELRQQSNALEDYAAMLEKSQQAGENAAKTQTSFRTRLRELRDTLIEMEAAGQRGTAEYEMLRNEFAKLTDAMGDAQKQAQILAHDQRGFQGIISGLGGVSGAFSAAQGAIGLFAGENENLQKIMVKVQSLMAITIGLQQVQAALDKDSAFRLVTLNGLKEWWAKVVRNATVAETQNTVATRANAAAQNAQTVAAGAGAVANRGLAASFRLVGTAIKSIPGLGWIAAAITALIAVISRLSSKTREAKKAQEEFNKSLVEGCYKPIGAIEQLAQKWNGLGDDFEAKKKFINENKKAFDDLGVSIKGVTDAENLLSSERGKEAFVNAQIEKAKAAIYLQQSLDKIKQQLENEQKINALPDKKTVTKYSSTGQAYTYTIPNKEKEKLKEDNAKLQAEIKKSYEDAATAEAKGVRLMQEAGIEMLGDKDFADGTVGAIEKQISDLQNSIKNMSDPAQIAKTKKQIKDLQDSLSSLLGDNQENVDFKTKLSKVKAEYQNFFKWLNSGDENLIKSAQTEFQGILAKGATYIEYLKNQRDEILKIDADKRSKEQNEQLRILQDNIAEETKKTVLESFNTELSNQLSNAKNIIEILKVIEEKRKELANDDTDIDNSKKEMLDNAEESALDNAAKRTQQLLDDYAGYTAKKEQIEEQFAADMLLLNEELAKAKANQDIKAQNRINDVIKNITEKRNTDLNTLDGLENYNALIREFGTFQQRKELIEQEYEEKRRIAREKNDQQLIASITAEEKKAISQLASDVLGKSDIIQNLFKNFDDVTINEINNIIDQINNKQIDIANDLTDEDIQRIVDSLANLRREVANKNPFTRLTNAIKEFRDNANDANFRNLTSALSELQGYYDKIVSSIAEIADYTGSSELQKISEIAEDVGDVASAVMQGFSSGGIWGAIIGGIVTAIPKIIKWADGTKMVEEANKKNLAYVKQLSTEYDKLAYALNKALGDERYTAQVGMIENLQNQIDALNTSINNMTGKAYDAETIAEYKQQIAQAEQQIQELLDNARDALLGSDIASIAAEFGDALIDAFAKGENAAEAWGDTVDKVVRRIVRNMIIQDIMEKSLKPIIEKYTHGWIDDGGNWVGWEAIENEINAFGNDLTNAGDGIIQMMEQLKERLPEWFESGTASTLTGAVKGVTEETASLVAGQMNAMRINQVESMSILRNQLASLNMIVENTSYNKHLQKLDRIANAVESLNGRAWGFN